MMHSKQHIASLPAILKKKGVRNIVVSPGSRNAPLVQVFNRSFHEACMSIVDERSAGYVALGLALFSEQPTVLISTSGTAAVNYGPAIAEAYHQGVPLIVLTADRPPEWIDMQDNQSIRQTHLFADNSKAEFQLPTVTISEEDLWLSNRLVNQAYNLAVSGMKGPVHINIPLREPLYEEIPEVSQAPVFSLVESQAFALSSELREEWEQAEKIFIVCGQMPPDPELNQYLNHISEDPRVAIMAEPVSNIHGSRIINAVDSLFMPMNMLPETLHPDLVIYVGGQVVSKQWKLYLRSLEVSQWYVTPASHFADPFQNLDRLIKVHPVSFFRDLLLLPKSKAKCAFSEKWIHRAQSLKVHQQDLLEQVEYSDLAVFKKLSQKFEKSDILFAGNSSVVRYMQMFPVNSHKVYANRGASGIDGCLSTSVGIAASASEKVISVVGDLSFVYDSNALWNRNLPSNFKIVVINNEGGGIFRMIPGPQEQEAFENLIEAHHPVDIEKLSAAFGVSYNYTDNLEHFDQVYEKFYTSDECSVLEIRTPKEVNALVFNWYIKNMKDYE